MFNQSHVSTSIRLTYMKTFTCREGLRGFLPPLGAIPISMKPDLQVIQCYINSFIFRISKTIYIGSIYSTP